MNTTLWIVQIIGALIFAASGVMKVFMLEKVSADVPSFGALPAWAWKALGVVELVCVIGLIVPAVLGWHTKLTALAAAVLACETLLFIWVHVKFREVGAIIFSSMLGVAMAFVAYGRAFIVPL